MKRVPTAAAAAGVGAIVLAIGVATATAVPIGFTQDRSAELAKQIDPNKPKSVILLIGDGMDDSMITAARNYSVGAAGRLHLDELPFTGAMTTYGLQVGPGPKYPIAYVSDSAPTASGWSTGRKTVDGRISQGPSAADTTPGTDYETVLEQFKKAGKLTGNVSTAEITDATPAAAAAHINLRACQGPANMANCQSALKANGGKGSIAEQLVDNKVDVLLGGGAARYAQPVPGGTQTVLDYAKTRHGYRSVTNKAELGAITSLQGGPVLGLFNSGNMIRKYAPLKAAATAPDGTPGAGSATTKCTPQARGEEPTLAAMTDKAIKLLDNDKGFFLQVEGASVDKAEHDRDICGAIGELEDLDQAVKVAMDYQKTHPDTLVIVTGDHSHSTQIVPRPIFEAAKSATVQTFDGDPMTVAYSTDYSAVNGTSATHTGAQIRVAAAGPQAANVTGVIDQTDLYNTMLGRTPSTMPGGTTTVTATPTTTPTSTPTTNPTSTPTSAPSKPVVEVAAPRKARRGSKAAVAVAVTNATSVKVTVRSGKKKVTKKLSPAGGTLNLRVGRGATTVVVVATGTDGTTTVTRTIKGR